MDIKGLKIDLSNNQAGYQRLVGRRTILNAEILELSSEIFRMEGVLTYIKAVINAEERKIAEAKQKAPVKKVPAKKKPA